MRNCEERVERREEICLANGDFSLIDELILIWHNANNRQKRGANAARASNRIWQPCGNVCGHVSAQP